MGNSFFITCICIIFFSNISKACFDKKDFELHKSYFKALNSKPKISDSQITKSYVEITKDCQFKHSDFKSVFLNLLSIQGFPAIFSFAITEKLLSSKKVKVNNLNIILGTKLPAHFLKIRGDFLVSLIQVLSSYESSKNEFQIFFKEYDIITNDCIKTIPEYSQSCRNMTAKYLARSLPLNKSGVSLLNQYLKVKKFAYDNLKPKSKLNYEYFGYIFNILNTGVAGSDSFIEVFDSLKNDKSVTEKQRFEISIGAANNTFKNSIK